MATFTIILLIIFPALGYYYANSINMRICMAVLITIIIGLLSVIFSVAAMGAFILLEIKRLNINNNNDVNIINADNDNIDDMENTHNTDDVDSMEYIGDIDDIEHMENNDINDDINK